jgi:hypothetical protein
VRRSGCCAGCNGTGYSGDPVAGGKCWDCYGTGHAHTGWCRYTAAPVLAVVLVVLGTLAAAGASTLIVFGHLVAATVCVMWTLAAGVSALLLVSTRTGTAARGTRKARR